MPSPNYYFKFEHKAWLSSSTIDEMSSAARGAYICLLCHQWEDGALPDDPEKLAKRAKISQKEFKKLWNEISFCFPVCEDGLRRNPKLAAQADACSGVSEKRSEAANLRWKKTESKPKRRCKSNANASGDADANAYANAMQMDMQTGMQNDAISELENSNKEIDKSISSATPVTEVPKKAKKDSLPQQVRYQRIQDVLQALSDVKGWGVVLAADVRRNLSKDRSGIGELLEWLDQAKASGKHDLDCDKAAVDMYLKAESEFDGKCSWESVFNHRGKLWKLITGTEDRPKLSIYDMVGGR